MKQIGLAVAAAAAGLSYPVSATELGALSAPATPRQVEVARPDEARLQRWMEQCGATASRRDSRAIREDCSAFPGTALHPFPQSYPVPPGYRVAGYQLVTVPTGTRAGPAPCCEVVTVSEIVIDASDPVPEGYVDAGPAPADAVDHD
ncbi:hypothetical protein [Novosphingobium huizhouense]|uniref:hypothetical protein n=1 Tax=Novosphingobium huizhouense TaxID=2866625 RepID=UPI001CD903B4|nr:hypothetical protein [Novosphingobium huizhouense]